MFYIHTYTGVLALKKAFNESYVVGLLMIKTLTYAIVMHEIYIPPSDYLPLEIAASVDHQRDTINKVVEGTEG